MQILKADTQVKVLVGPFVDTADGVTPETGVTLGSADQAEILKHDAASVTDISGNTWAAMTGCDGWYNLTLTAGNVDTEGMLTVVIQDSSVCLPVFARFMVVSANVYDSLYAAAATDYLQVDAVQISGDATAADNAELDYDGTGYAKDNSSVGSVSGAVGSVTGAVGDLTAASHIWHVAKTGNDSNGGHRFNDAKLTVSAAVTAAASGDTINIWPGDYAESVDASDKALNIIGAQREKVRIVPASGSFSFRVGSGSYCANLSVIGPATVGISISSTQTDITLENCYGYGPTDGLYISALSGTHYNIRLIDCTFESPWDGANMGAVEGVFVERCTFQTSGGANSSHALQQPGTGIYKNCIFWSKSSTESDAELGGLRLCDSIIGRVIFDSCYIYTEATATRTGKVYGVRVDSATVAAILSNCNIITIGSGADGGPLDLYQANGELIERGCRYSTTAGTITHIGSGWADAGGSDLDAIKTKTDNLPEAKTG